MDKAPAYEPGVFEFESQYLLHAVVAQLVERRPSKSNVVGSNPIHRSNLIRGLHETFSGLSNQKFTER